MPELEAAYRGYRDEDGVHVRIEGEGRARQLPPRNSLVDHSPDGFEWGYGGSGPAQLALALLADALGTTMDRHKADREAIRLHHKYKWAVVNYLEHAGWYLTRAAVIEGARRIAEDHVTRPPARSIPRFD